MAKYEWRVVGTRLHPRGCRERSGGQLPDELFPDHLDVFQAGRVLLGQVEAGQADELQPILLVATADKLDTLLGGAGDSPLRQRPAASQAEVHSGALLHLEATVLGCLG